MTFHNRVVGERECKSISANLIWNVYVRGRAANRWWPHCKRAALELSGVVDASRAEKSVRVQWGAGGECCALEISLALASTEKYEERLNLHPR